jgi:alpha-beta hydrolase superfamily lysophospholipase
MLVAGDDRLVDSRVALEVGRSLAIPDITVMEWPNAFHEVLNAPDRSEVFAELLSWIQARASAAR